MNASRYQTARRCLPVVAGLLLTVVSVHANAVPDLSAFSVTTQPDGTQKYSVTLQILAVMTALTPLPSFVIMMTAFTRIIVVFAILRQAIGLHRRRRTRSSSASRCS